MTIYLKENPDLIIFFDSLAEGSFVTSISKPTGFFVWAMFLKSGKLCLAHTGYTWNGKDFGPNSVAWVGFKSLSGMSSLEPGICI